MSDIYLSLTETPTVVTLSQPVVSGALAGSVTVTNVVSVNVVTMPAITVQAAAPAVTTVAGTVSISNFPSTQTISGTVTVGNSVTIGSLPAISGTVTANLPALNWNTVKIAYEQRTVFNGIYKKGSSGYVDQEGGGTPEYLPVDGFFSGGTTPKLTRGTYPGGPLSFTGTRWYFVDEGDVQFYSTTTATDLRAISDWTDSGGSEADVQITPYSVEPVAIPGGVGIAYSDSTESPSLVTNSNPFPVKVQNSVTIGSLPAISGTVTANNSVLSNVLDYDGNNYFLKIGGRTAGGKTDYPINVSGTVTIGSLPAISGTVTVGNTVAISGTVTANPTGTQTVAGTVTVSGISTSVTARLINPAGTAVTYAEVGTAGSPSIDVLSVQGVSGGTALPVQLPRVTLIDGSGTVTTANSAITVFASSSTRSYLLVQVTTGSAFVNAGASATTVNGLSLTAGQCYAWENTIPQGLVSLISTVTSSRWVAKEA